MTNEGKVLSNEVLLETIKDPKETISTEFLRVLMKRLKEKVETETENQTIITDEGGMGYKLVAH
ncbi:helix-turn-helix domain-containing protein [Chloroflexota bacterium]